VLLGCLPLVACVVQEARPQPQLQAVQAVREIPADERLDIIVHDFDPGIPEAMADDEQALAKKRIYPQLREAEGRYLAVLLRNTLETSAQWGAVRVAPEAAKFLDVQVQGRILESTGKHLALEITARDMAGRTWLDHKRYEADADIGSYTTDEALKARDPFQNLYVAIADDLVAARGRLAGADLRELRRVTQLAFAGDLAPQALDGYLGTGTGKPALRRVVRLPAEDDPVLQRVERIRERDAAVIDTLDGYYLAFADQMQFSYGDFRRASYDEVDKEERARASARTRTILGAAAVAASILAPGGCDSTASCNLQSALRYGGATGGVAAFLSGLKRYADARTHAQALGELARSFQSEVAPQVVDVEGRSLRLTGTTEEQYRQWRQLLAEYYAQDAAPATGTP
jgi:hypothetical protein